LNELLFLRFAEIDPNVKAIAAQPTRVVAQSCGRAFSHIPDFALIVAGEGEIFEVKSDEAYAKAEVRERLSAAAEFVDSTGWTYFVALRTDLREHPFRGQVEDLWRQYRRPYSQLQKLAVQETLRKQELRIADVRSLVESRMGSDAPTFEVVVSLAANAEIFIDLSTPVSDGSLIRYPDHQAMPPVLLPRRRPARDLAMTKDA
jgi:hypothetical protein